MSLAALQQINQLASELPHKTFLLTKIGCRIAGFEESDIAPLFSESPTNVIKPEGW